jgi:hypothetical protein
MRITYGTTRNAKDRSLRRRRLLGCSISVYWKANFLRWCQVGVKISSTKYGQNQPLGDFTCKSPHFRSGAEGIRTPDLRRAKAALSQLSYGPRPDQETSLPQLRE